MPGSLLHGQPIDFEGTWPLLEQWVHQLLTSSATAGIAHDDWMKLHTCVYKICTIADPYFGKAIPDILYYRLKTSMEKFVETMSLDVLSAGDILMELLPRWDNYVLGLRCLHGIFDYLNRYWIADHCASSDSPLPDVFPIHQMGIVIWREQMLRRIQTSIYHRCFQEIEKERSGVWAEIPSVKLYIDTLIHVGYVVGDNMQLYETMFEASYLRDSFDYFCRVSDLLMMEMAVVPYVMQVEDTLLLEMHRAASYLHSHTLPMLTKECDKALIMRQIDALHREFSILLLKFPQNTDSLSQIFGLLMRLENGGDFASGLVHQRIMESGNAIVGQYMSNPNVKEISSPMVLGLLDLYRHNSNLVNETLKKENACVRALDTAFRSVVNSHPRCAEILSRICHVLLKDGPRAAFDQLPFATSEDSMDTILNDVVNIVKYINDRDVFQAFYFQYFMQRVIEGSSLSNDHEEMMMLLLKEAVGYEFGSKLHRMMKDKILMPTLNQRFRLWMEQQQHDNNAEMANINDNNNNNNNNEDEDDNDTAKLEVTLLTLGIWPLKPQHIVYRIPTQLSKGIDQFERFFLSQHNGRKITWELSWSFVTVRATYLAKPYEISMTILQYCILSLFDEYVTQLCVGDVVAALGIAENDLDTTLSALYKSKLIRTMKDGYFSLNLDYNNKRMKVRVAAAHRVEASPHVEQVHEDIEADRKILIQAAIVRVMKAKRELEHNELAAETTQQLAHLFQPAFKDIKENIEILIDKEYLSRQGQSAYKYIA